jgi:hypothetical protein
MLFATINQSLYSYNNWMEKYYNELIYAYNIIISYTERNCDDLLNYMSFEDFTRFLYSRSTPYVLQY